MNRNEFVKKVKHLSNSYSVITSGHVTYIQLNGAAVATISEEKEYAFTVDFSVGNIPYRDTLLDVILKQYVSTSLKERDSARFLIPIGYGVYLSEGQNGLRLTNEEVYWRQFEIDQATKYYRLSINLDALKIEVKQ